MNILINAIRLNSAGGFRVGINILKSLDNINPGKHKIFFLCNKESYDIYTSINITKINIPSNLLRKHNWLLAQAWLKKQINHLQGDFIFNLCNTPIKTDLPQLLLLHWPYAAYSDDYIWDRMNLSDWIKRKVRLYFIKKNYRYINHLTVQTFAMKSAGKKGFLGSKEITVIPSSIDLSLSDATNINPITGLKKFLYLSSYYPHKNHNILIAVARIIQERNLNFIIQVTISDKNKGGEKLLRKIKQAGVSNILENLGEIIPNEVDQVLDNAYATINPSFLESFGLTYLESAAKNKLVLASKLDFVIETLQDGAIYFDPFNPESIVSAMIASTDSNLYLEKIQKSRIIVEEWPSWKTITTDYLNLIDKVYRNSIDKK